ncbi:TRAP transporter small permease [Anaerotruncus rubiinfantis]|uniref:TRAP transporter small permease n=1 Tax=Anaerotruncus rubiinfantis TaxID=1720200 RepID=UPI00189BA71F|nr:TRAP transporter small permease subunit [Anaerotruncus rubiinfantis]
MKRLIKFLESDLPLMISGGALTLSIILAVVNAVLRYSISYTINGADAVITLCFAYTVFVGSAAAYKRGAHYGVDVLVSHLSERSKKVVQVLLDAILIVVMLLGFWLSVNLTKNAGNKTFEGLSILPYSVYDMSAVIGFGYSIVYSVEFFIADLKKLTQKEENT